MASTRARRFVTAGVLACALAAYFSWRRGSGESRLGSASDSPKENGPATEGTGVPAQGSGPAASASRDGGPVLDRGRADRVRALLRAAATAPEAVTTADTARGQAYAEMPTGSSEDGGTLLRDYVRSVIREDYFPLAKQCYEATLAKNPELKGRIEMRFAVVGDKKIGGVVETAEFDDETTTIIDPDFRTCLRESMLSVSFDAPPGGRVTVKYPIEFSPDEPEERDPGRKR